ncbi:stromal membrane-associated protein 1 isoform X3 [Callorhinchus milii]|uniref:stromal membrane-associated protein 1 isoform X3 n=1 Tax=Callorhinchus milii TaxID=7868 RepID=UPI001C3FA364|nr:stromal membrane-associated protein 1 isoform X3 [Callorhinchus milii]
MATRSERERSQKQNEQHQAILSKLLREEDNKYCADCEAKGPRWASWNLGVFICIRCAGIHRNLGVHISRVKSVNLDQWTPEQIQCMQDMGNTRARHQYEKNLPENFRRPQTDQAVEFFIRDKYEKKKYTDKNVNNGVTREKDKRKDEKKRGKDQEKSSKPLGFDKVKMSPPHTMGLPTSILGLTGGDQHTESISVTRKKEHAEIKASPQKVAQSIDLLGLDTPVEGPVANGNTSGSTSLKDDLDIFGPMVSNPLPASNAPLPQPVSTKPPAALSAAGGDLDLFTEAATKSEDSAKKPLSKDSILSLYGTGTMQQQQAQPAAVFMAPSQMPFITHTAASYPNFPNIGAAMPATAGMMGSMMGQPVGMMGQPPGMMVGIGMPNGFMGSAQTGVMGVPENMMAAPGGMVGSAVNPQTMYSVQQSQQPQWNQVNQQMAGMNLNCPTGVMGFGQPAGTMGAWASNPTGQTLSTQLWK